MLNTNLKTLRLSHKLTQKELSDKIGIARNTLNGYELGIRSPDYPTLITIANYFDVSLDYLLGRDSGINDISDSEKKYNEYLQEEYWKLIKKLDIAEIKILKSIVDDGISLVDLNNALKELQEKKNNKKPD
jgi:transcriptional regulator with XRE-family HTH domain